MVGDEILQTTVPPIVATAAVPAFAIAALLYAAIAYYTTPAASVRGGSSQSSEPLLQAEQGNKAILDKINELQSAIAEGARAFLLLEYRYIGYFMAAFAVILFVLLGTPDGLTTQWTKNDDGTFSAPKLSHGAFTAASFLLGALASLASGWIGMQVAVGANGRTCWAAYSSGVKAAFETAFKSGASAGFALAGLGLAAVFIAIVAFRTYFDQGGDYRDWFSLFDSVCGFGVGGSSMALFGRVGGGIFTKASDVGADLVGKVEQSIPEDDPRNPATIADNVGDNVGDVAGMSSDLFGSFAEATSSALVLSSVSELGETHNTVGLLFPLILTGVSIMACMVSCVAVPSPKDIAGVQSTLKMQLVLSCAVMAVFSFVATMTCLPSTFKGVFLFNKEMEVHNYSVFVCILLGLLNGLVTGLVTEYYTSYSFNPVRQLARASGMGAGSNIIFGLAVGYKSVVLPVIGVAASIFVSYSLASFYGVAMAALGILGTLASCLAVDIYGPISDNAGGIAEMAELGSDVRSITDALDSAGNTTAAIGKGFAIGSAALVAVALFGSYIATANIATSDASLLDVRVYLGLLLGAGMPYIFTSMTMVSVGKAANEMVEEVRRQFAQSAAILEGTMKPDYARCVEISTRSSIVEMVAPGALVLGMPILVGLLFGTQTLAGLLAGSVVSGVAMATSSANSGGAWDNAKKLLEDSDSDITHEVGGKGSDAHTASVIGDTVGDPLKDTSGPALNILIKLMAVESLVLAPFFSQYTPDGLLFKFVPSTNNS